MVNKNDIKFSLRDVTIVPEVISNIRSRQQCRIKGDLPLFVAPMTSVFDGNSILRDILKNNGLNYIYPRTISNDLKRQYLANGEWVAVGLDEFVPIIETTFKSDEYKVSENKNIKVLIDIANGHMNILINDIKFIKNKYGKKVTIMAGNIANPLTFKELALVGCDYVRCGIGSGQACTTSANSAIHYPMGSLIEEVYAIKKEFNLQTKIIADGGMSNFDDIIKALALGADYVMVGSLLNKAYESSAKTLKITGVYSEHINQYKEEYDKNVTYIKEYYGMSTKKAQKLIGNEKLKTAEGIVKKQEVKYTIPQWVDNFRDYLASAMSYTNCVFLHEFIGQVKVILITNNSFNTFYK